MLNSPIAEIKSKLDIVDILSEYITLKPSGTHSLKALCPFHNEKSPSLMVSRDKQIWHCFGCHKGGDIFTFIQEQEGLSFPEVLRQLAQKAGVKLTAQNPVKANEKTKLLNINELTASYFHQYLLKKPEAQSIRNYLETRKISSQSIEQFKIGYSPNSWDELHNFLLKRGFTATEILNAGITTKNSAGKYFDRFRGRLMFPIFDHNNSIIGFGGRILDDTNKKEAKYINSPQTLVYDKSYVLYGLNFAKNEIKKNNLAVVVEGYLDVISSHQAGVTNVVASSGTALTAQQVALLGRYSKKIALSFDADQAGQDATKRGIEIALQAGYDIKIIKIPNGKDPDECIKNNPTDWKTAIAEAQEFMKYYFEQTISKLNLNEPKGKKEASDILLPIINKISDVVEKAFWLKKLASLLDIEESVLKDKSKQLNIVGTHKKTATQNQTTTQNTVGAQDFELPQQSAVKPILTTKPIVKNKEYQLCEKLLATIILNPPLLENNSKFITPEMISGQINQDLYKTLIIYYTITNSKDKDFSHYLQNNNLELLSSYNTLELLADKEFGELSPEELKRENSRISSQIKESYILKKRKEIQHEMIKAETIGDTKKIENLTKEFNKLI
jgi:DNA primase